MLSGLALACALLPQSLPGAPLGGEPREIVRVLRDAWGAPHVLAQSDYGAFFGHGWVVAEDQLEAVLDALWTAQGRRSEIEGARALPLDRAHRLLRVHADVEAAWDGFSERVRESATAFAGGINAYMRAHPERVPPWAESVRPTWPLALGRLVAFLPQVRLANAELGSLAPGMAVLAMGVDEAHYRTYGSNAWALAPERTTFGAGVLVLDPHLPWKHELRLYEVHLRGATFEVAGAAFLGVPLPLFAHNRRVAWGWTWNDPDHADVYRLTLDPADPERYLFDGERVAFETREHAFRMPDGEVVRERLRWSVHGPVHAHVPERGFAVAYRLTAMGAVDGFEQVHAMVRARSVAELDAAMERLQVPSFNLVAADADGETLYVWGGRVPHRPRGLDASRPLDGSTSATLWDADGLVPWRSLPRVASPAVGFVQSCNNGPAWTTGTSADPRDAATPPGVVRASGDTVRARYLRERIGARERHSLDDVRALATDGTMIAHAPLARVLRRAWDEHGASFAARAAIADDVELLLAWDGRPSLASAAPTLFLAWLVELDGELPSVARIATADDDVDAERTHELLGALAGARATLRRRALTARVPWGALHVIRRGDATIPVESGMVPAVSLMNATVDLGARGGPTCRSGSAYVAVHALGDPIRRWSVMPLGPTDDPRSPWFDVQTRAYARRELAPRPFTDAELQAAETAETHLVVER